MATVFAFSRSLPAIVNDLATTRQRIACLDDSANDDPRWDELTDRRDALELEAKAAVYAATGVSADMLLAVLS